MELLIEFANHFFDMFVDMSVYILIGLFFVGILHVYVKKESILKHLGEKRFSSVIKASAVGVPLPLCSCGVVPTAIELKKGGASNGAVISFLTSTPQTGIDSIFATYSLMGPVMAIFRPISAFCSGIISGILVNSFAKDDIVEENVEISSCCSTATSCCSAEPPPEETSSCCCSTKSETTCCEVEESSSSCCCSSTPKKEGHKFISALKYGYGDFLDEISIHFLIGMAVASCISTLLPADFFVSLGLHQGIVSMLAMVLIGLPMYICSASSIPIAMSLMAKGLSLGGGFVFLFTGPVTNMASLIVLQKALGKKVIALYIASVVGCSIIFGSILDVFAQHFQLTDSIIDCHSGHNELGIFSYLSATIFAILILKGFIKASKQKINQK